MSVSDNASGNSFTDLAQIKQVSTKKRPKGNIIKSGHVLKEGTRKVGIFTGHDEELTVIVHKSGDVIESAEFVCKCGRRSVLKFDYEEE